MRARQAGQTIRRVASAMALAAAVVGAEPAAAGPVKVEVAASPERGYGRLVLTVKDRTALPVYAAKLANGVLVIEFGEPIAIDIDTISPALKDYVSVARRDPEGNAIRFALRQNVRVNTMEAGERLFVDFLPPTWTALPPQLPPEVMAELGRRAEEALRAARRLEADRAAAARRAQLDVRIAEAPTFSRLLFGWNLSFDANVTRREDGALEIVFSRTAPLDIGAVRARLPAGLTAVEATEEDGRLKVVLRLAPGVEVRSFREDLAYIVDVMKPARPAGHLPSPLPASEPAAAPNIASPAAPPQPNAQPHPSQPIVAPTPGTKAPAPGLAGAPAPATPVTRPLAEAPTADRAGVEAPGGSPAFRDVADVRAEAKAVGSVVRLAFPFPAPVAAAVFQRDRVLWIVFDSTVPIDLASMTATLGGRAEVIGRATIDGAQVIRLRLREPAIVSATADGPTWTIALGGAAAMSEPLVVDRVLRRGTQMALQVGFDRARSVHVLTDPEIGDRIAVVTALAPARGLLKPQVFAELGLLPSAQGLAALLFADDVEARIEEAGVVFAAERGLSVSPSPGAPRASLTPRGATKISRDAHPLAALATREIAAFREQRRALEDAAADADEMDRKAHRLALARFYVANGLAAEALGVLNLLARTSNAVERDPRYQILRAAADTLLGRGEAALATLRRPDLAEDAEAAFWRVLAAAELGLAAEVRAAAERGSTAAPAAPRALQAAFQLALAAAEIDTGERRAPAERLAEIDRAELDRALAGRHDLLQARLLDAAGRPEDALFLLDRTVLAGDRRNEAEAEFHRIRILAREGKIDAEEAVRRLHTLALSWRGDELSLRTMVALATRLVTVERYREAFVLMREAMLVQPGSETARQLQADMQRVFVAMFHDGKADAMKPIEALALFYDFRELTPPGRQGDEIVRRLADRLVSVDLLDQAAELLTHQIDNRVKGAARAQVAADLAVVHLLDRQPERALSVLARTRQAELPQVVERQRRIVEAKALAESGKVDVALDLIGALRGTDAERVAADTLWRAERWQAAAERYEAMLAGRWGDGVPLDQSERLDVLKAAIAYGLAKDALGLERLRGKFSAKMANGPEARAFAVLTEPVESRGTEAREIAREIAALDTMRGFLADYRARYLGKALPAGPEPPGPAPVPPPTAAGTPAPPAPGRVASR